MSEKKNLSSKYQPWIDARKKFKLSHAHIQMAKELGMNPKKFGKLANHKQESWKEPLPKFIEHLYFKRFKREEPEIVRSIEEMVEYKKKKNTERKERKQKRLQETEKERQANKTIHPTGEPGG